MVLRFWWKSLLIWILWFSLVRWPDIFPAPRKPRCIWLPYGFGLALCIVFLFSCFFLICLVSNVSIRLHALFRYECCFSHASLAYFPSSSKCKTKTSMWILCEWAFFSKTISIWMIFFTHYFMAWFYYAVQISSFSSSRSPMVYIATKYFQQSSATGKRGGWEERYRQCSAEINSLKN